MKKCFFLIICFFCCFTGCKVANEPFNDFKATLNILEKKDTITYSIFNQIIQNQRLDSKITTSNNVFLIKSLDTLAKCMLKQSDTVIGSKITSHTELCSDDEKRFLNVLNNQDTSIFHSDFLLNSICFNKLYSVYRINYLLKLEFPQKPLFEIGLLKENVNILQKEEVKWSPEQKDYVTNLIKKANQQIVYYELVEAEYNTLIKSTINKKDLLDLKRFYTRPIQQLFIDNKLRELGYQ